MITTAENTIDLEHAIEFCEVAVRNARQNPQLSDRAVVSQLLSLLHRDHAVVRGIDDVMTDEDLPENLLAESITMRMERSEMVLSKYVWRVDITVADWQPEAIRTRVVARNERGDGCDRWINATPFKTEDIGGRTIASFELEASEE